jgi:hypothetical protein
MGLFEPVSAMARGAVTGLKDLCNGTPRTASLSTMETDAASSPATAVILGVPIDSNRIGQQSVTHTPPCHR